MNCCLSVEQQKLVDLVADLADVFTDCASEYDREKTFPHRNYEDLREAGFLTFGTSRAQQAERRTRQGPTGAATAGDGPWCYHTARDHAHPVGRTAGRRLVPHPQHPPVVHAAQGRRKSAHFVFSDQRNGLVGFDETGHSGRAKSTV
jgi:hypothetical protein